MIKAVIFDLDGTLVQTERLKARSYARAVADLCPRSLSEDLVIEAYKDLVGVSRQVMAQSLVDRFDLEGNLSEAMDRSGVGTPWQAFVQLRMGHYREMLSDPETLLQFTCPYAMGLLTTTRERGLLTGLATMSHCPEAMRVMDILGIRDLFDFVATVDDVATPKPDPEIYLLVASELGQAPSECLVIEDSASGVQAATAAKMHCIVVTTGYTRKGVHDQSLLPNRWILDDARALGTAAEAMLKEQGAGD